MQEMLAEWLIECGDQGKPFIQRMHKEEGKDPFFEQVAKL